MMAATTAILMTATAATAGLVATQIPGAEEVLTISGRIEKLGIIGVLSACLIVCLFAIGWIVHEATTQWKTLVERAILAANNAAVGAQRLETASAELKQAANVLSEITAHCRVHRQGGG